MLQQNIARLAKGNTIMREESTALTKKLGEFIFTMDKSKIPDHIFEHTKVAFMDWLAVTIAGRDDPLVEKLIKYSDLVGGHEQATIIGHGIKKSLVHTALINGSASHALDYDDSLIAFMGHPSVTIFPSILAISEWQEKSGTDFLTAYLVGLAVGSAIGVCAGFEHYAAGWHATSTLGHFASAAGCAKLLQLTQKEAIYALGIAGTQACGLKRVFGTMCKPFHAGNASQAGLMSALLAEEEFTCVDDILEGKLGFFQVAKGKVDPNVIDKLGESWEVENLAQKYHASCHATHSPIEGARDIVAKNQIQVESIQSIKIFSSQIALDAAGKINPMTGMEAKFSIPYCVANALLYSNTGIQAFDNEKINQHNIRSLMDKISVQLTDEFSALETRVEITTNSGNVYSTVSNIMDEIPDLDKKRESISAKFEDLCGPVFGSKETKELSNTILTLEKLDNMRDLITRLNIKH